VCSSDRDTVISMNAAGISTVPHLSFGNDDEQVILDLLREYKAAGISRIVALRGDVPSGMGAQRLIYAEELVQFIRDHTGDHFQLEVAAYPEVHPDAKGPENSDNRLWPRRLSDSSFFDATRPSHHHVRTIF